MNQTAGRPTGRKKVVGTPATEGGPVGFQRPPKLYPLEWTAGEWTGMQVTVRRMSYGHMLDGGVTLDWNAPGTPREEWLAGIRATTAALASVLESWNLLDTDGEPVPCTLEGLRSREDDQAIAIVMAWAVRVLGVSVPLDKRSDGGATSLEASIPMATSSENLAS